MTLDASIVVAFFTLLGVVVSAVASVTAAYISKKARMAADEINNAVNHRHLKERKDGSIPPKLYDMVIESYEKFDSLFQEISEVKKNQVAIWKNLTEVKEWQTKIKNNDCKKGCCNEKKQ